MYRWLLNSDGFQRRTRQARIAIVVAVLLTLLAGITLIATLTKGGLLSRSSIVEPERAERPAPG